MPVDDVNSPSIWRKPCTTTSTNGCARIMGEMIIDETSNINYDYPQENFIGEIEVGNYCAIARNVVMHGTDHTQDKPCIQGKLYNDLFDERIPRVTDKIVIKNDVWIGRGATILKGVTIGNGAIIGAQAVVTKDVEPYEIVAGNPAKHVGWRIEDPEKREFMNELEWWNWSKGKIMMNKEFFNADISENSVEELKNMIKFNGD